MKLRENGEPRTRIAVSHEQPYTPDDLWVTEPADDGRIVRRLSDLPVHIPSGAARIAGGALLSQRSIHRSDIRFWDVIDESGQILQSQPLPQEWLYPSAVTFDGSRAYVIGEQDGTPAVIMVTIRYVREDER